MTDERITLLDGCAELGTTYRVFKGAMTRIGITPERGGTVSNGGKPPTTISRDELVLVEAEINIYAFVAPQDVGELFDKFTRYTGWHCELAQRMNVRTDRLAGWQEGKCKMRQFNYDKLVALLAEDNSQDERDFVSQQKVDELFSKHPCHKKGQYYLARRMNVRRQTVLSWIHGTRKMRQFNYDRLEQLLAEVENG